MESIFTKEKINTGRQRELDVAKALAVVFMVLVHVYEVYGEALKGTPFSEVVEFLGSPPAAPVFMFMLGVGIVYSRKNTPKILLVRGIKIFLLGYILNFIRDFIPYMILANTEPERRYENMTEAWDSLFGIDILMFAGLALIFFAIVKKYNVKDKFLLILWCIFASAGLLLSSVSFDSETLNSIFGLFWGTDEYAWFPFLTWIFYPILGYLFANLLTRCKDKDKLYKEMFLITSFLSMALWLCAIIKKINFGHFDLYQTAYYQHDIIGNIIMGVFVFFWISVIYFVTKFIPEPIYKMTARWSKNCNGIYCAHWIILGYSMIALEDNYGALLLCILTVIIFILSDIISELLSRKNIRI